jgi:hypothetical protein
MLALKTERKNKMIKLVGYERKTGNMVDTKTGQLIEWDKYILHYLTDERPEVKGMFADNVEADPKKLQFMGCKTIDEALGKQVMFGTDMTAKTDANGKTKINVNRIVVLGDAK